MDKTLDSSNVCSYSNAAIIFNNYNIQHRCFQILLECIMNRVPISDWEQLDGDLCRKLLHELGTTSLQTQSIGY